MANESKWTIPKIKIELDKRGVCHKGLRLKADFMGKLMENVNSGGAPLTVSHANHAPVKAQSNENAAQGLLQQIIDLERIRYENMREAYWHSRFVIVVVALVICFFIYFFYERQMEQIKLIN